MKVLLLNGSPRKEGCTFTALSEVAKTLNHNGIDTEIFQAGNPDTDNVKAAAATVSSNTAIDHGKGGSYLEPYGTSEVGTAVIAFSALIAGQVAAASKKSLCPWAKSYIG